MALMMTVVVPQSGAALSVLLLLLLAGGLPAKGQLAELLQLTGAVLALKLLMM